MRVLLPTILLIASFGVAQTPAPGGAEQKTSRLEGRVVGSANEVIPRATLQLQIGPGGRSYSAVGGDDGRFVFEGVPPGLYTLSATKDGYLTQRYGAPVHTGSSLNAPAGTVLNLAGGEELKNLSIQMTRQSIVSGRVSNREGEPVVGARVDVLRYQFKNARRELLSVANQRANDLGEFRIPGLGPGRYYLVSTHAEQPGPADAETNITTFYPSAREASAAAPLDVAAGAEARGIEIRLQKARTYSIRGKAVGLDSSGQQRGRLRLRIEPYDRPDWRNDEVFVNTIGEFEVRNLLPGRYLLFTPLAGVSSNLTGRMEVTLVNSDVNNVVMEVGPRSRVTGRVEIEDGSRARVSNIVLAINGSGWGGQLKEDGTFEVTNLQEGKYHVQVFGLGDGTYVKSVEFNGQQVTHQAVDAGTGGTMRIVLSATAAHVAGRVQDETGKVMAGATVSVWPKTPDPGRINGGAQQTNTDQNGRFRLTGLPPGDYLIAAWEELEQGLADSVEFLAFFSSGAKTVTLRESAREELELRPVPRKKILEEIAKLQ